MPRSDGLLSARALCTNSVDTRHIADNAISSDEIADGAIDTPVMFASGIVPVQVVSSLPGGGVEGDMAYLTTDDKLYRHDGGAWIVATDGADIEAATIAGDRMIANTLTAGQIQAGAIGASELAAINISVGKFIRSTTYTPGSAGWSIDANGSAEFDDVTVRGTIEASSIEGNLTLGTGGLFRSSGSGQRVEIDAVDQDQIKLITADSFEASGGTLRSIIVGAGGTRQLTTTLFAPITTGDTGGTFADLRTESQNDSSLPPQVILGYTGGSAQTPEFKLGDGMKMMLEAGSASAPSLTYNIDSNTGFFLITGEVTHTKDGNRGFGFWADSTEARLMGKGDTSYLEYNISADQWKFIINGVDEVILGTAGFLVGNVNADFSGTGDDTVLIDSSNQLHVNTSAINLKKHVTEWWRELAAIPIPPPIRYQARAIQGRTVNPRWQYGWTREAWHEADEHLVSMRDGEPHNYIDRAVVALLGAHILDLEGRVAALEAI